MSLILWSYLILFIKLFHDGGCYHIETSPLISKANQWTGFYLITASVMKELNKCQNFIFLIFLYLSILFYIFMFCQELNSLSNIYEDMNGFFLVFVSRCSPLKVVKEQCFCFMETSQLIYCANQMNGFYELTRHLLVQRWKH